MVDAGAFATVYAPLARDATLELEARSPWLEGLYVSTAHGSRGLVTAPLAGEILAAYLEDEPAPWRHATNGGEYIAWLTAEELAEVNQALHDVMDRYTSRLEQPETRPEGSRMTRRLSVGLPGSSTAAMRFSSA